jgi:hypothetical protein
MANFDVTKYLLYLVVKAVQCYHFQMEERRKRIAYVFLRCRHSKMHDKAHTEKTLASNFFAKVNSISAFFLCAKRRLQFVKIQETKTEEKTLLPATFLT